MSDEPVPQSSNLQSLEPIYHSFRPLQQPAPSSQLPVAAFLNERSQKPKEITRMAKSKKESLPPMPITVVLPGDDVTDTVLQSQPTSQPPSFTGKPKLPKLGVGLRYDPITKRVTAACAGRLQQHRNNKTFFIQQNTKRYIPALEDRVVVIVEDRIGSDGNGGDLYRVTMNGQHPGLLSSLAFEGATKRNKPSLQPGVLLYARIATLYRNGIMDPVLSCQIGPRDMEGGVQRRDWMTNEGTYGELKGGTVQRISLGLARELLRPQNAVLAELAQHNIAFELAVGVNGLVWVHSTHMEYTIMIMNAIQNSEIMTEPQVRAMVKSLVYTVHKQMQQDMDQES